MTSKIEQRYQARVDSLSAKQCFERCEAMLQWTRELLGRQIVAESDSMSDERLKWEVAKRLYCGDPEATALINRKLAEILD